MQYIVIAHDFADPEALKRRMNARQNHITLGDRMKAEGSALFGAALLNDEEKMNGSVYVVDFPSRIELDNWLKEEPYVTGRVWDKIEIVPCKVGPSFINQ